MKKVFLIFPIIFLVGCKTMPLTPPLPVSCASGDKGLRMVNPSSHYPSTEGINSSSSSKGVSLSIMVSPFNIEDLGQ